MLIPGLRTINYFLVMLTTSITLTSSETPDNVANLCPPERKTLRCPGNDVIVVVSARYDNQAACPRFTENGDCTVDDPMGFMTLRCFRKNSCSISDEDFENARNQPCEGAAIKPLVVKYNCVPEHRITEMCIEDHMINGRVIETGFVISPNYPFPYDADRSCSQQVMASLGQVIRITLLDVQLEDHPHPELDTCYDQLVLMQRDSQGVKSKTFCQSGPRSLDNIDTTVTFNLTRNEYIEASFESTSQVHNRGFLFKYEVIGCAMSGIPKAPAHGRVQRVIHNDMAIYACDPGFAFDTPGDTTIYCRGNAWQGTPVHCIPDQSGHSSSSTHTTTQSTATSSTITSTIITTSTTPATPVPSSSTTSTTSSTVTPSAPTSATTQSESTLSRSSLSTLLFSIVTTRLMPLSPSTTKAPILFTTSQSTSTTQPKTVATGPVQSFPQWPVTTATPVSEVVTSLTTSSSAKPVAGVTDSGNPFIPERPRSLPPRTSIGIGVGVGGALAILIILLAILLFVKCRQSRSQKPTYTKEGMDTLRPSAHACGSIPGMYAGISYNHSKNRPSREGGYVNEGYTSRSSDYSVDSAMFEAHRKSDCSGSSPSSGSARESLHDDIYDSGTFLLAHEAALGYIDSRGNDSINRTELMTIHEELPDSASYVSRGSSVSRATAETSVAVPPGQVRHMMRPSSLQDTKNVKAKSKKRKVDYPLFKVDSTGNLENYLESRRVSV